MGITAFHFLVGVTPAAFGDVAGLKFMCVGGAKGCPEGRLMVEIIFF